MSVPLAIFDMDGTLVDSRLTIRKALERAFAEAGLPPPSQDAARRVVGLSLAEAMTRLSPDPEDHGLTLRLVEAYKSALYEHRVKKLYDEPLFDGAKALLERLKAEGWFIALATGKSRRGVNAVFEAHALAPLFDAAFCADDGPGKPNPFMVQAAIERVGGSAGRSVMIGDSEHDIGAARAARAQAWGVAWGFQSADELTQAGAHAVYDAFPQLSEALDAFARDRA